MVGRVGGVSIVALLCLASVASALDWPNFRGPRYDGISTETGFHKKWDKELPLVWERKIGPAFSSLAIVGDRIFTAGTVDKKQTVFCLNATNGDVIWQAPIEKEYKDQFGDGMRSTPTVSDGRVYVLGALGTLMCLDAKTGSPLWKKTFDHRPQWGYAASVLVEGDLAISSGGQSDGALVAFNKKTGEKVWQVGDDPAGYAMPYPFTHDGEQYVVGFTGKSALVVKIDTGKLAVRIPWKTDWNVNAAMPLYHDGYLLLTSGYRTGAGLFKLDEKADSLTATSIWKSKVMLNKFQTAILYDGHLFVSDQRRLVCVDFLTGKEIWKKSGFRNGTLLLADKYLLLLTENGELQIAPASLDGFKPTTTAKILSGRCWSVPVISDGKLYARNLKRVVSFDLGT